MLLTHSQTLLCGNEKQLIWVFMMLNEKKKRYGKECMQQCVSHVVIIFIMLHITPLLAELELQSLATINFTSLYTHTHIHIPSPISFSIQLSASDSLLCMLITTAIFSSSSLFLLSLNFMLLSLNFFYIFFALNTHFFRFMYIILRNFVFNHVRISWELLNGRLVGKSLV